MSARRRDGHVYFAACGKYVKIGHTAKATAAERIKSLPGRIKVPADFDPADTIWLMHSIPGCVIRDERRVHDLFAAHRVEGEWFYMSRAFLAQLAGLRYVTYYDETCALRTARAELRRNGVAAYSTPGFGKATRPIGIRNPNQQLADTG